MRITKLFFGLVLALLLISGLLKENRLIFVEEFNTNILDEQQWNYDLGDGCPTLCGWGNKELQVYTKDNISVRNGQLIIEATKAKDHYYSGRLTTKDKIEFQYGVVEVKAKLPKGMGVWPAIWMLGHDIDENSWPQCGEIDIMEYVGRLPNQIHTTLHTSDSYGASKNSKITTIEDIENGFHVYKIDWNKDRIQFYIDDERVYTFSPEIKTPEIWPFDKPFYLVINLAVGGYFGGFEVDDDIFPQEFIIDYIKIYKS